MTNKNSKWEKRFFFIIESYLRAEDNHNTEAKYSRTQTSHGWPHIKYNSGNITVPSSLDNACPSQKAFSSKIHLANKFITTQKDLNFYEPSLC